MTYEILQAINGSRFLYTSEDELQEGLAKVLTEAGFNVHREVRLTPRDRIDLMVGRVGIEVKIAGRPWSVLGQLQRYAESPAINELILVTTKARHEAPARLNGKPVTVVFIARGV